MSKKIKNGFYLLIMIILMIFIVAVPNYTNAKTETEKREEAMNLLNSIANTHQIYNNNIPIRFGLLQQRHDLYCVGYLRDISGWRTYINSVYVNIVGNKATFHKKGQTGTTNNNNKANGTLAYILSTKGGYGYVPGSWVNQNKFSDTQKAVYAFINEWFRSAGMDDWTVPANDKWQDNSIVEDAKNYANKIGDATSNSQVVAEDTTDKDDIELLYYTESNGTQYIKVGPFNWTFTGVINSVTLTGNNGVQPDLKIFKSDGVTETDAEGIESGRDFYVSFRADTGMTSISKLEGKGKNSEKGIISADIWFLEDVVDGYQKLMLANTTTEEPKEYTIVTENIPLIINFSVIKVDEYDQTIHLANVGFKFYNKDVGKYIQFELNENNEVSKINYVDSIEEATELSTDQNGKIELNGVLAGTYIAYETKNPNYGYVVDSTGKEIIPVQDGEYVLTNKPAYMKVSGLVWEDIQSGKMSVRNDLYRLDETDDLDIPVEGVEVRLKDRRTGNLVDKKVEGTASDEVIVNPTYTDAEGNYHFDYVSSDELENYYVEFEYDGLVYQNVIPHLEVVEKGSKAAEPDRQAFNNNFATIEKGNNELQAVAKDQNGKEQGKINYEITDESTELKRFLQMSSTENCEIIANTDAAGYTIKLEDRENNEIKHINLGIYKRLQTDLSIRSEIAKVTAEINGYGHVYNYMTGDNALGNQSIEDWTLGIRNYNKYKNAYERPVYKADAEYTNSSDPSKELRMSMIYEISVLNESQLYSKVNQIVSYFNNQYTVSAIGTKVNEKGVIEGNVLSKNDYKVEGYNDLYNKLTINTNVLNEIINPPTVAAEEGQSKVTQQKIYVQFDLSREAIADMLNEGDTLDKTLNVVSEIASYTSYSDRNGTIYAAYDLDSVPNNATLNNESTYEDDTEKASPIALTIANARQITGTVFEDLQIANDQNTAEGNGMFDADSETKLNGVEVHLIYAENGEEVSYINVAGNEVRPEVNIVNGDYTITGFIPGEYQVKFTWGDGTTRIDSGKGYNGGSENITVENYKSTVMDYNTYNAENSNRKYYLDTNIMNGKSQAIDNTDTRKEIDSSLINYKHDSDSSIEEISSTILPISCGIEYSAEEITNVILDGQNVRFLLQNMNFGIIRRPEQKLQLDKTVSNFKFTLPSGQVLIDATIDENGNLIGETNYLSYIGDRSNPGGSVIRAEIDENLIQGSQLQITYTLKATNVGQADFLDNTYGYYKFGESYYTVVGQEQKDQDIITSSPALIVDYLDESLQYDQTSQINIDNGWELVKLNKEESEQANREKLDIGVLDNVLTHKYTDSEGNEIELENYTIYKTSHLANTDLKPRYSRNSTGESASVQMVVGQNLSSSLGSSTQNQAEVILITKPGGGKITETPGNYIPNKERQEIDDTTSERVVVIPSTGGNMNYILPITISVVACIIFGVGVYLIKTKVLKKENE